jgi:alpha-tubulin suppressor-like RCC1 family protein
MTSAPLNGKTVNKVVCGYRFCIVTTTDNLNLGAWGEQATGQLGDGSGTTTRSTPVSCYRGNSPYLPAASTITKVTCGPAHCFALTLGIVII